MNNESHITSRDTNEKNISKLGALFLLIWFILVGLKLYQLGSEKDKES